jgi:hypothetical protein
VWLQVAPKELFGALGGVVIAAPSSRQEAQPLFFAALGLVQIAPQGIADQGRHPWLFSLGQKVQLTIRAFIKNKVMRFI